MKYNKYTKNLNKYARYRKLNNQNYLSEIKEELNRPSFGSKNNNITDTNENNFFDEDKFWSLWGKYGDNKENKKDNFDYYRNYINPQNN